MVAAPGAGWVVPSALSVVAGWLFSFILVLVLPSCFTQCLVLLWGTSFLPPIAFFLLFFPFLDIVFFHFYFFFLLILPFLSFVQVVWSAGLHTFRPRIQGVRHRMVKLPVLLETSSISRRGMVNYSQ